MTPEKYNEAVSLRNKIKNDEKLLQTIKDYGESSKELNHIKIPFIKPSGQTHEVYLTTFTKEMVDHMHRKEMALIQRRINQNMKLFEEL